jgi:hypothetical protein
VASRAEPASGEADPIVAAGAVRAHRPGWVNGAVPAAALEGSESVPGAGAALDEPWVGRARRGPASGRDPDLVAPPAGQAPPVAGRAPLSTEREPGSAGREPPASARPRFDEASHTWTAPFASFDLSDRWTADLVAPSAGHAPPPAGRAPVSMERESVSAWREVSASARPRFDDAPRSWTARWTAAADATEPLAAARGAHPLDATVPPHLAEPLGATADALELADALAELLDDESDLRGLLR